MTKRGEALTGIVLGEHETLTLEALAGLCTVEPDWVLELVEYGVLEPLDPIGRQWEFSAVVLKRVKTAARLRHDLELGTAGIAVALDLLDEIEALRARLHTLGGLG